MIEDNFQSRKLIQVTVLLYLWLLLQVQSYHLSKLEARDGYGFEFVCDQNEGLDNSRSDKDYENVNGTIIATALIFWMCPPPKKPFLEILKEINIDASQVTRIFFLEMADTDSLKESLFEGMPLTDLSINDYHVSVNRTEKLDLSRGFKYVIECDDDEQSLFNKKALFQNRFLTVSFVIFNGCEHPNASYFYILSKLRINPVTIKKLELRINRSHLPLTADHFKGLLHFDKLVLTYETFHALNPEIFEEISVDELYLNGVELNTLQKFKVNEATLQDGKFLGEWGDCSTLKSLTLQNFDVSKFPSGWIRYCKHLTDLTVINCTLKGVEEMIIGAHELLNLEIHNCGIRELGKHFAEDSVKLRRLKIYEYINNNRLIYIHNDAFDALKSLEELEISYVRLSALEILKAITPLKNLRNLIMDGIPLESFCESETFIDNKNIPGVEKLSLKHSSISKICFTAWQNLTYLDLSFNKISYLNIYGLPAPDKRPLTVDLTGNPFRTVPKLTKSYYPAVSEKFNESQNITIILQMTVRCDCEHSWFVTALRALPQISLEYATCSSGERLVDFTGDKFRCDKYFCDGCTCRTSWDDNATIANCESMQLVNLPEVWNFEIIDDNYVTMKKIVLKKLLVSNNLIKVLPAFYPSNLVEIDLRSNHISYLSESAIKVLFSGQRRVHLSGNPFVCNCETQAMIYALSMYKDQIPDYKKLHCIYRDKYSYLYELSDHSLCLERAIFIFGIFSVSLIAFAAIVTSLYFRYKLTIKAFLYARGLCLYCVTERDLDADKEYDAFISFAGLDEELVEEELLPGLENDYKLCVHTRDWIPGEEIYTQILESVEKSRRTVIVLTKNFVESVWGIVEFRTAYIKALHEGRIRVICILVDDDINDMDLAPDVKAYLKTNTYLKFRDPWFWQKLRYALPHPSVSTESGLQNDNEDNRCQEIELASR